MELQYIADRKLPTKQQQFRDLEDALFFVLDEKGHSVHLTDQGHTALSPDDPGALRGAGHLGGGAPDRQGPRADAGRAGGQASRGGGGVRRQEREAPHHPQAAAGPRAVRQGRGLPGPGQPGPDRGRVHRPRAGRAPLGRRAAPGGRGQGRGDGQGRDPDARHHHDPELLPDVRQAGGHDRHRRDRGAGVLQHLRARGERHSHQQAHPPHGPARPDLPDPAGEIQRGRRGGRAAPEARPAGADRHHVGRRVGDALQDAPARRPQARSAERQVPPARGGDRRGRGPGGRRHHRDQHGGPRHRHQTRRRASPRRGSRPTRRRGRSRSTRRSAGSTSSAPSGTSRAASTASCAAGRAARAIRARRSSSCRSKTTSCACSAATGLRA